MAKGLTLICAAVRYLGGMQTGMTHKQWPQELDGQNEEAMRDTGSILGALRHHCMIFPLCLITCILTDALDNTASQ